MEMQEPFPASRAVDRETSSIDGHTVPLLNLWTIKCFQLTEENPCQYENFTQKGLKQGRFLK